MNPDQELKQVSFQRKGVEFWFFKDFKKRIIEVLELEISENELNLYVGEYKIQEPDQKPLSEIFEEYGIINADIIEVEPGFIQKFN